MYYANFPTSGMYAVTACMLQHLGLDTTDVELALRIHLPCLITEENGEYHAGTELCSPQWMNLALLPMGWRMVEETLPAEGVTDRLRTLPTAAIMLPDEEGDSRWMVYAGQESRKFRFLNMCMKGSPDADCLLLTSGALRKALTGDVALRYLEPCEPQPVDMTGPLIESLKALVSYHQALHALWNEYLDRAHAKAVRETLLRPLLTYLTPLTLLLEDELLHTALTRLRQILLPMFYGKPLTIHLEYHVPFESVSLLLHALREHIRDHIALMTNDEELIEYIYEISSMQ